MSLPILIIGSNSFSGSNLIKHLLLANNNVIAISRQKEIQNPYNPYSTLVTNSNFEFHQVDLNTNADKIIKICKKNNVSTIVNFSAQSMVGESWIYPEQWYKTNVVALSELISLFKMNNIKLNKFIHFSTPEVYGNTTGAIKENFSFMPTTPYAISRAAGDYHLKAMFETNGFPVIFTRAANVYGEHQSNYRIIPKTFIFGMTGKKLSLHGGGNSERSFIHIDDVSRSLLNITNNGIIGSSYHISTNKIIKISELVSMCCLIMGIEFDDISRVSEDRAGKDAVYRLDSSRLRDSLGWTDEIGLDEGLKRTCNWVRQNLDHILKFPTEYQHRK